MSTAQSPPWGTAIAEREFRLEGRDVCKFPGGSSPGGAEGAVPGPRRPVQGRGPPTNCESVEPGRAPQTDAHRSEGHPAGEREQSRDEWLHADRPGDGDL